MPVRKIGSRAKPHHVTLCKWARPTKSKSRGRSVALFAFSYRDVAELFGLKVKTVQKLAKNGVLEMTSLESLFSYWRKKIEKSTSGDPAAAPDPALPYN